MTKQRSAGIKAAIDQANAFFRNSDNDKVAERRAIAEFVKSLLLGANMYRGFSYLNAEQSVEGHTIGIIFDHSPAHKHQFPDETRIYIL